LLFNAIAGYFADLPQFEFLWIGDGIDAHLLTAPNITITGWLSPAEAKSLLLTSDVYLSTAKFEGLSFAVLEALALKKPVLLTDCVGNRDMVNQGLNGDLFTSPQQAIIKIIQYFNNGHMLPVMGGHSGLHCEDAFDILQTKDRYKDLYLGDNQFSINQAII
jgi:glycosyltransferase involved in cell wall biosynthesis